MKPHSGDAQANFEWGTTPRLGKGSTKIDLPPNCNDVTVTLTLPSAAAGDIYYRLITESEGGNVYPPVGLLDG